MAGDPTGSAFGIAAIITAAAAFVTAFGGAVVSIVRAIRGTSKGADRGA